MVCGRLLARAVATMPVFTGRPILASAGDEWHAVDNRAPTITPAASIPATASAQFLTKAELREAAMPEIKISKNSFDFAWISAIEETRRYDCDNAFNIDGNPQWALS
jgi:hypothetical protein